jgi:outer membrane biosynthesis protein TonB
MKGRQRYWLKFMQSDYLSKKWNVSRTPSQVWLVAVLASILLHLISGGWMKIMMTLPRHRIPEVVKIKIATVEAPKTELLPPKPREKQKPKKETLAPNTEVQANMPLTETPVQGLSKDTLSEQGTMAAPVGNTLMKEDEGQRLQAVDALKGDMSAPAKLITSTLAPPPYSDEALDAMLEGSFIVDVFINLDGTVREAELRRKIGYGMDGRVLTAVRASKFIPRKNKIGISEEGWTELKFTLVIP